MWMAPPWVMQCTTHAAVCTDPACPYLVPLPATSEFLLFFKYVRHASCSSSFHRTAPLPQMLSPRISVWLVHLPSSAPFWNVTRFKVLPPSPLPPQMFPISLFCFIFPPSTYHHLTYSTVYLFIWFIAYFFSIEHILWGQRLVFVLFSALSLVPKTVPDK